jgi:ubiquinone/menaquinone biosynthesis C-methylase UbiE
MTWAEHNPAKRIEVPPYQMLANIYDKLMAHVDYVNWANFIADLLRRETGSREVLELACGTGTLANLLHHHGFTVQGYDACEMMINFANRKYKRHNLEFEVADFLNFPLKKQFDAVICLYDSINYIMQMEELILFLSRVKEVLKPGGIFIFDICTQFNSRTNFRQYHDSGIIEGYQYFRFSDYDLNTRIHSNDFQIYRTSESDLIFTEHHRQLIYSLREIRKAVKEAGLIMEERFDDINFRKAHSRSLRVHFLCRRLG